MACQQRCLQRHIRDVCRCYDESLPVPRVPERDILGCHELNFPPECSATPNDTGRCVDALMTWYEQIRCAKRVREQVQASRAEMARCQCRAACDERYYEVSYSLARWPAPGFESDAVYHSIFDVNRFMEQFNDSATFRRHFNASGDRSKAMEDFARINVYVADPEVLVTKESPEYDETALVSDIGGQLGLWIGASLITAAEILEFVWNVVNKFFDLRACRRRRKPRRPSSANDVGI